jgi:hypothetical protein
VCHLTAPLQRNIPLSVNETKMSLAVYCHCAADDLDLAVARVAPLGDRSIVVRSGWHRNTLVANASGKPKRGTALMKGPKYSTLDSSYVRDFTE